MASPRAPAGLSRRGKGLWRDVVGIYDLRPDEIRMLEDACRTADLVEQMTAALKNASLTVCGSQGQPVINPLVQEIRQHRQVMRSLLIALKLPTEDDRDGAARSDAARKAAHARWGS